MKFGLIGGALALTLGLAGPAFADIKIGASVSETGPASSLGDITLTQAIANGLPLRIVGEPVFYEPLAVAVDKGDAEFTQKIAEIVGAMHADGTLTALSEKWFGVDLTRAERRRVTVVQDPELELGSEYRGERTALLDPRERIRNQREDVEAHDGEP